MRVLACLLLASAVLAGGAHAQDYYFGVTYDTNLALQDSKDFAGDFSWIGMSLEGRKMFRPDASVGFVFGWHEMDKEFTGVQSLAPGIDVYSAQKRYINSFPMLLNAHYYFGQQGQLRPHLGLGIGAYLVERRVEVGGLYQLDEDTWHFGLAPEVGVAWRVGWQAAGLAGVRLNWAVKADDVEELYLNFRIGMAWL